MTSKQKDIYEEVRDEILLMAGDKTFLLENPLTRLGKLLQASEGGYNIYPHLIESGKLNYAKDEIIPYLYKTGKKGILWFRYIRGTEILHSWLPNSSVLYNGNQSQDYKYLCKLAFQGAKTDLEKNRFKELLEKYPDFVFKNPGDCPIMIATYSRKSGSGLNFQCCDEQWYFSYDYSSTSFKQSSERIKRMDTKFDKLFTNMLISEDSNEKIWVPKLLHKLENNAKVLDGIGSSESIRARDIIKDIRKYV